MERTRRPHSKYAAVFLNCRRERKTPPSPAPLPASSIITTRAEHKPNRTRHATWLIICLIGDRRRWPVIISCWPPRGGDGEEAAAADDGGGAQARARRGPGVGAAVAVGQDGLLPRRHARVAPPRLRAAAPRRAPRPRPPARAPLRLPPRRRRRHQRQRPLRLGRARPGAGLRLPVIPRRPARRLRRARAPHPLRVRGVRRGRRVPVGGGGVRGGVRVLRAGQGGRRAAAPRRAGAARGRGGGAGSHDPSVPGARRRAHRRGVPDQLPRAPAHARLQDRRRRRGEAKRRPSDAQRAEAV